MRLAPTVALLLLIPAAAQAQVLELRGGVTTAPVLGFGGVRVESTPRDKRPLTFGASVDYGGGAESATFFTIMLADMWLGKAYPSLNFKSWSPRVGLAGTILISDAVAPLNGGDGIGGGWGLIVGAEHRTRMFAEVQLNFMHGLPRAYFVVGYRMH